MAQTTEEEATSPYLNVEIGNSHALEGYRLPGDEALLFRLQEPQGVERVTHVKVVRDQPVERQVIEIMNALGHQMAPGEKPDWIECANADLTKALVAHFGLPKESTRRPATWGRMPKEGS